MFNANQGGLNFASAAGQGQDLDSGLIPKGQLVWLNVQVRKLHNTQEGKRSLDCEFTIAEGQKYAGRKIWSFISDPSWETNTPEGKSAGMVAICRMLEAGLGASPSNPSAYVLPDPPDGFLKLNGLRVAARLGIDKGTNGYEDKNSIAEFLSPNPESASFKMWSALTAGHNNWEDLKKVTKTASAPATASVMGAPAPFAGAGTLPQPTPSIAPPPFMAPTQAPTPAAATGFQMPQPQAQTPPAWGGAVSGVTAPASALAPAANLAAPSASPSPSNQAAPAAGGAYAPAAPGWMAGNQS